MKSIEKDYKLTPKQRLIEHQAQYAAKEYKTKTSAYEKMYFLKRLKKEILERVLELIDLKGIKNTVSIK